MEDFILDEDEDDFNFDLESFGRPVAPVTPLLPLKAPAPKSASTKRPSLMNQFEQYSFSDQIKNKACEISNTLNVKNMREDSLKQFHFYCIWRAHVSMGIHTVPAILGASMGLSRDQVSKAISRFSKIPGQPFYDSFVKPIDIIPQFCQRLEMTHDAIEAMQSAFDRLLKKEPRLNNYKADTLIVAFMVYHLNVNGYQVDVAGLSEKFEVKTATVKSIWKEISDADNKTG